MTQDVGTARFSRPRGSVLHPASKPWLFLYPPARLHPHQHAARTTASITMAANTSTTNGGVEKTRRSRITAACAVCRAKRQKCSGQKPVCDQCRSHNEECWWSDQKKRGPAKDYLRSLQDRLQETEKLLLGVLGQVSDDGLHSALQQANSSVPAPSHQTWTNSCSGQEYWNQNPLSEIASIRRWQQHRNSSELANPASQPQPAQPSQARATRATRASAPMQASVGAPFMSSVPQNGPYYQTPHTAQFNGDAALTDPGYQRPNHERRYSEETRDVAEALYSISNHPVENPPQQEQAQTATQQESNVTTAGPDKLEPLPSEFPKQLFW